MVVDKTYPTEFPRVVDAHCHLGYFRNFHIPDNDADGIVGVFDRLGIDVGVVAAHAGISADFRLGNDEVMRAAERHPGRVLGYCCVNPNYPAEVGPELERCFAHSAFRGIKLHPELHGNYPVDGANYRPVWEFAADRSVPVLVHTYFGGDPLAVFDRLAGAYPQVPLLLGHGGLDLGIGAAVAMARDHQNVYLDLTGPASWDGVVEYLVRELGSARLLFGSDIPFVNAALQLGGCAYARIADEDRRRILGENARVLFGTDDRATVAEMAG